MTFHSRRFAVAAVLALATLPLAATTLVEVPDGELVDRAGLIVQATIEAQVPTGADTPATDWLVAVDQVLKGSFGGGRLVVREPGGLGPDGLATRFYGSPPFAPGVQALLFLTELDDGTYGISFFPQGAFVSARTARRTLALRSFSEVTILDRSGRVGGYEPFRQLDRFARWIEDRAAGSDRLPDYVVKPRRSELRTVSEEFTFLAGSDGLPLRWQDFDSGGSVAWHLNPTAAPGLADGGVWELQQALAAWTNEPTTPIRLGFAGTSSASLGLTKSDRENTLIWGDPNQEYGGSFSCSGGGTLAFSAPWYFPSQTHVFNGQPYHPIVEGDIIFNDGFECMRSRSRSFTKLVEEIMAHELGHTLGLGHSSENRREPKFKLKDALMFAYAHDDKRGARLAGDDIAGLQTLYRVGGAIGGGGGGGGGGGQPGCPASTLCLLGGRFQVKVAWENQFNGSKGAAQPIFNSDLSGFFYFTDPANVELIVKILDFGDSVKVFYSELTNLHFTMTVTDTTTGKSKSYKNTPGDCGAIDDDFGAAAAASTFASGLSSQTAAASGACKSGATTLCLSAGRFAVTVDWRNQFNGASGAGRAKSLSALTGAFSFDDPSNLEILIKTLDFGNILVIYGSLSNFEYTIHVLDTTTGVTKDYRNAAGHYCGGLDQNAF